MKLIRRKEVEAKTGLSRSAIYDHMSKGTFLKNYKIGRRAVAWLEDDITRWIQDKCI